MLNQLTNHCSLRTDGDSHINFWSNNWGYDLPNWTHWGYISQTSNKYGELVSYI